MTYRASKQISHKVAAAVLAIATTGCLYLSFEYLQSRPLPISGPIASGYRFTVVAMDGARPLELVHEWSGEVQRLGGSSGAGRRPSRALQAFAESSIKQPIVWADSGRATGSFRYYLTDADLRKVSSQLDSKPQEYPHQVRIKVLYDDPENKRQTLQLTVSGDDTDFINVYQVENDRVQPLKWVRFRPLVLFPIIVSLPVVLIISGFIWGRLLRRMFLSQS